MGTTHKLLRFGVFELNLDTEELRKAGLRVHTAKTIMRTPEDKADLARAVLDAVGGQMAAHAGPDPS